MDYLTKTLDLKELEFSKNQEAVQYVVYVAAAFLVPFFIGQPQLVVGTIVNASLILTALNFKGNKILPVILLPSVAVLSRGLIFGPFTMYLILTMPFIWIGNSVLVYSIKRFYLGAKWNKYFVLTFSIIAKVLLLYLSTSLLIKTGILPKIFSTSMGMFQLYTAIAGCALALIVQRKLKK